MKISNKAAATVLLAFVLVIAAVIIIVSSPASFWPAYCLTGVWGSSSSDVFAVGSRGVIIHYDGSGWSRMQSNTTSELYDVWGTSSSDVYAVGDGGVILHYDGNKWSRMTSDSPHRLHGVWGSSPSDIYAVGDEGTILHNNGSGWNRIESNITTVIWRIWGNSATDIFFAGEDILHYDGSSFYTYNVSPAWRAIDVSHSMFVSGIWSADSGEIFATHLESDAILHFNGTEWSITTEDPGHISGHHLYDIWGVSSNLVFAVGGTKIQRICKYNGEEWDYYHWAEGDEWSAGPLWGIWGTSANDIFAVGGAGAVLHYDGNEWVDMRYDRAFWVGVWLLVAAGVVALTGVGMWVVRRRRRAGVGQGVEL